MTSCFQLSQVAVTSVERPCAVGMTPPVASLGTASGTPSTKYVTTTAPPTTMLGQRNNAPHSAIAAPTARVTVIIVTNAAS